jgi:predicted nucleic acid-binding protein
VTRWVVDASVGVKWCVSAREEDFIPHAAALLNSYDRGEAEFLVPDLFWPELANALWKAVWKQKIDGPWAKAAYEKVADLAIATVPTFNSVPEALQLADAYGRSVYDSVYIVLALHARAHLITADERLANAMAARFPVKWLGAL